MFPLELVWTILTTIAAIMLAFVFWKHFFLLAGDRGGICLEVGLLTMVTGLMLISLGEYQLLPLVVVTSLAAFFMGYVRLQNLLRQMNE